MQDDRLRISEGLVKGLFVHRLVKTSSLHSRDRGVACACPTRRNSISSGESRICFRGLAPRSARYMLYAGGWPFVDLF